MEMSHLSQKLRILGWRLFCFQQFLQLPLFGLFICYIFLLIDRITFLITFSVINLLFSIVLLLNLLSILLISASPFIYIDYPEDDTQNSRIQFIILILGIIWVLWRLFFNYMLGYLSIIIGWNVDFFKEYGFIFLNGFGYFRPTYDYEMILNPLIYYDPFSILLLIFFFLQDNFLFSKRDIKSGTFPIINIGTYYGLTLVFGDLILHPLIFSRISDNLILNNYSSIIFIFILLVTWKLLIVPIVGLYTAQKYLTSMKKEPEYKMIKTISKSKLFLERNKNVFKIFKSTAGWTNKTICIIFMLISIIILIVPISPFFCLKSLDIDSTPKIEGPYISRNASEEGLEVLKQIENLSLKDLVGLTPILYNTTFLVCNDTLNYFVDRIPTKESLDEIIHERLAYRPEDYFFNWSVRVVKNDTSSIKPTEIFQYWSKLSSTISPLIFTLWVNNTQFWCDFPNICQSIFVNVSFHPAWIFYGTFSYSSYQHGNLDLVVIEAEQLILLDEDLKFICFIYDLHG